MDDASDEKKMTPASSQGLNNITEDKLRMTSPNNNRILIGSQMNVSSIRREKNSNYTRKNPNANDIVSGMLPSNGDNEGLGLLPLMSPSNSDHGFKRCNSQRSFTSHRSMNRSSRSNPRNFDSPQVAGYLPSDSNGNQNGYDGKLSLMSPSNSVHSFARCDTQKSFASLASHRSKTRRTKNTKLAHYRNQSFNSLEISRLVKRGQNSHNSLRNGATPNGLNSVVPSPNDIFPTATPQTNTSRQKSKASRQKELEAKYFLPSLSTRTRNGESSNDRNKVGEKLGMLSPNNISFVITDGRRCGRRARRKSLSANIGEADLPLPSLENGVGENHRKEDTNATSPLQKRIQGPNRETEPVPSNSVHSGAQSVWTEMTIHSDTYLQNQDDSDSSTDNSAYYSDGCVSYSGRDEDEVEDEVDDDDSSNTNFNYLARDNGSLQTLSSAFSLNDLGSISSVSTLSVDGEGSNKNDAECLDKQIHFIISPSRQLERQQRRNSNSSFRRRPRTYSDGSMGKSGDEYTVEEEITVDGSIPELPNLPTHVGDLRIKHSYSESCDDMIDDGDEMEEVTVGDDEYIEELVNDPSENHDDSAKRYEIIVSDDSYIEEIVLEVDDDDDEEEETTEVEIIEDTEKAESITDYRSDGDEETIIFEESSDCQADDENEANFPVGYADDECENRYLDSPLQMRDRLEYNDHNGSLLTVDKKPKGMVDSTGKQAEAELSPHIDGNLITTKNCWKVVKEEETSNCEAPRMDGNAQVDSKGDDRKSFPIKSYRDALKGSKPRYGRRYSCGHGIEYLKVPHEQAKCRKDSGHEDNDDVKPPSMNGNAQVSSKRDENKFSPTKSYRDALMGSKARYGRRFSC